MKSKKISIVVLCIALLFGLLSSCKKDNDEIPSSEKPQIDALEIGSDNGKSVSAGSDLHIEGNIIAESLIAKIDIEIHQEGGGSFKINKSYTDGKYIGVKNTTFHEHLDIPSEAPAGNYHLHFSVTDKAGNTETVESPLTVTAAEGKVSYKLVFTEVKAAPHNDHFHDIEDKAGVEPISINFDKAGKALAADHIHLAPEGIYKIELKEFDDEGKETQGQYIKNKATADQYKAFLIGGSFILNTKSTNLTGAIFQTKETTYSDGTPLPAGATETTGIISYFTAGKDNEGEKNVKYVLRKFNDSITKANITREHWNLADYQTKFPGNDIISLEFEIHAELEND